MDFLEYPHTVRLCVTIYTSAVRDNVLCSVSQIALQNPDDLSTHIITLLHYYHCVLTSTATQEIYYILKVNHNNNNNNTIILSRRGKVAQQVRLLPDSTSVLLCQPTETRWSNCCCGFESRVSCPRPRSPRWSVNIKRVRARKRGFIRGSERSGSPVSR